MIFLTPVRNINLDHSTRPGDWCLPPCRLDFDSFGPRLVARPPETGPNQQYRGQPNGVYLKVQVGDRPPQSVHNVQGASKVFRLSTQPDARVPGTYGYDIALRSTSDQNTSSTG